jgi:hypothetical protein
MATCYSLFFMGKARQKHAFELFLKGLPMALDVLKDPKRDFKECGSEFIGAMGEIVAADLLKMDLVSHDFNGHDLAFGDRKVEVKAKRNPASKSLKLSGKDASEVCVVVFERRGSEVYATRAYVREIADGPGQRPGKTDLIGGKSGVCNRRCL